MSAQPRTARGTRTKEAIVRAAETVFAELGYNDASIVRITDAAGVGQGTFYLYFASKLEVFNEVVEDLNRRVRHAMTSAAVAADTRAASERAGFRAFFEFTAQHPALYRIIRQAEFVSPGAMRMHYTRIVAGYIHGLTEARGRGEVGDIDPAVAAWSLMGIGEMIGMRWVLWGDDAASPGADDDPYASGTREIPDEVFEQMMRFIEGGLGTRDNSAGTHTEGALS
ncbi:DNA-binding transcriptional regulator, AcrR family [Paramicrobacterium humi]|uniref:DNA-binding transcriptional regulator, AcrR family n=1 Tax=Paramicrobacterium humi TaxID=640635 RepID=A0A1H4PI11_9MICO|nr:TetR/AcrR family transcriptional regulator [Microbacterium humi]SEC06712.1 DNA-binding transcriptional regulator, AcrR family [Microbacterium humi]